jgi:hypothetical protein
MVEAVDVPVGRVEADRSRVMRGAVLVLPLFAVTIFLGAVLVFGVQPIAARMLLPYFGGSPAVWSATSLFFQVALLAGYGYSYVLTNRVSPRFQPLVHLPVLAIPIVLLPLSLPISEATLQGLPPAIAVMTVLALGVGLPFTVAATTGPLLQRWFSFTGHRWADDPYFLYAASNAGSLLVLLAYPFLIEPRWDLDEQATLWSAGFLAFAALAATSGLVVFRRVTQSAPQERIDTAAAASISWTTRARWLVLAAIPAALSLGVTQHISTDIAAIPLLWIAPLALYLLSFVLAFSRSNPLTAEVAGRVMPWALAAVLIAPFLAPPIWVLLGVHLAFLFIAAMVCHARLAGERPDPSRLTEYYLLLSIGGALGGAFVSLVAPLVFEAVWEYPIAIVAALLVRPRVPGGVSRRVLVGIALAVLAAASLVVASATIPSVAPPWIPILALGVCVVAIARWRLAPALVAAIVLGSIIVGGGQAIHADRTFFGVYRVTEDAEAHSLIHGTTVHGMQFTDPARRSIPTAYYHPSGPIGQVFGMHDRLDRVGVIGLGVGTLASYGQAGERMTFYEIDPAVVSMARNPSLFTFIADSEATVETVVADGRRGLAADDATYALLVVDAFSSDAIPVHLVTREAVALYADRIADDGLIAFHITNRFVDLEPVLGAIANSLGLDALIQDDQSVTPAQAAEGKRPSAWVLLATGATPLEPFVEDGWWRPLVTDPADRVWTDGYSDLVGALR